MKDELTQLKSTTSLDAKEAWLVVGPKESRVSGFHIILEEEAQ